MESRHTAGLDHTGLNTTHGHCSNSSNFVDILEGQPEGLVGGPAGGDDGVEGLKQGHAVGLTLLPLNVPALVPGHVGGSLNHVVTMPSRDWHESNGSGVVTDLLDESGHLLLDLLEPGLGVGGLGGVHLVHGDDELLHTQGVGKQSMLPGLSVLRDTSLELSSSGGDDEDTAVSLACSSDHVLDEVTMAGGVDDGDVVLGSLELPQSDVDGDATLALGLQLVHDPCILEGSLARLLGLLLELLDGPLVNTSTLVDQVASGGGFARVDVANDDNVDMDLFLSHPEGLETRYDLTLLL